MTVVVIDGTKYADEYIRNETAYIKLASVGPRSFNTDKSRPAYLHARDLEFPARCVLIFYNDSGMPLFITEIEQEIQKYEIVEVKWNPVE